MGFGNLSVVFMLLLFDCALTLSTCTIDLWLPLSINGTNCGSMGTRSIGGRVLELSQEHCVSSTLSITLKQRVLVKDTEADRIHGNNEMMDVAVGR